MAGHSPDGVRVLVVDHAMHVDVPEDRVHLRGRDPSSQLGGGAEARIGHPQRIPHPLLEEGVEALARHLLDDERHRHEPDVGVDGAVSRRVLEREIAYGVLVGAPALHLQIKATEGGQPPAVEQEVSDRDAGLGGVSPAPPREKVHHGRIQIEPALVHQDHGRGGRAQHLGERGQIVDRARGGGPGRRVPIQPAVAPEPDQLSAAPHGHHRAGRRPVGDGLGHQVVQGPEAPGAHPGRTGAALELRDRHGHCARGFGDIRGRGRPASARGSDGPGEAVPHGVEGRDGYGQASADGRLAEEGADRSSLRHLPVSPGDQVGRYVGQGHQQIRISERGDQERTLLPDFADEVGQGVRDVDLTGSRPRRHVGAHQHQVDVLGPEAEGVVGLGRGVRVDPYPAHGRDPAGHSRIEGRARHQVVGSGIGHAEDPPGHGRIHGHGNRTVPEEGHGAGRRGVGERHVSRAPHHVVHGVQIHHPPAVEPGPGLGLEHPAGRGPDAARIHAPRDHGGDDGVDGLGHIGGHEQDVASGLQRQHRQLTGSVAIGESPHDQGVGEEEAGEAHLVPEELGHEAGIQRGRRSVRALDPGHDDVSRHDGVHPGLHRLPERHQLHGVEPVPVRRNHRKVQVRVGPGVPVSREVLRRGEHTALVCPLDVRGPQPGHGGRVLTEGARVDNGVVGVRVDVQHGSEVQVDADRLRLDRRDAPVLPDEALVPDGSEGHGGRKAGSTALRQHGRQGVGVVDPHPRPAVLEVRGDQERDPGPGLELVDLRRVRVRQPDGQVDAPDLVVLDPPGPLEELGAAGRRVRAGQPLDDELSHLLAEGQGRQGLVHPGPGLAVQRPRAGSERPGARAWRGQLPPFPGSHRGAAADPQDGQDGRKTKRPTAHWQ